MRNKKQSLKRTDYIGCLVEEGLKEIYERECIKEDRSISTMTSILIKNFLLERGIDANKCAGAK